MADKDEGGNVLTIDPKKIKEGTCRILEFPKTKERVSVCKEDGKIKVYPIEED